MLGDSKSEKQILATTVFTSLFLSVASMLFFYLFPNITALLFSDSRCTDMFVTMLPALISTSIYSVTRGWFWGKKDYLVFSSSELVQEVLSIAIVAMALLSGIFRDKSRAIAVAFVVSDYIATAILVVLFFRKGGRLARPAKFGEVYRSALPLTSSRLLGSLVSSLMALLIPSLLVKYGMDTSLATASYGRASGMVMPLLFAPSPAISQRSRPYLPPSRTPYSYPSCRLAYSYRYICLWAKKYALRYITTISRARS